MMGFASLYPSYENSFSHVGTRVVHPSYA